MKLSPFSAAVYFLRRKPFLQKEQTENVLVSVRDRLKHCRDSKSRYEIVNEKKK